MNRTPSPSRPVRGWWLTLTIATLLSLPLVAADKQGPANFVTVRPLHTGICKIGKDHVLGADYPEDERLNFIIYSFLVKGSNGENALIDFGPVSLGYCNRMFVQHGIFRDLGDGAPEESRFPDNISQPHGNVFDQLSDLKLAPSEIDHIVFSHLHADHHGIDDATDGGAAERFPDAILHVSANGWNDNLNKRIGGRWNSYVDFSFADFLLRADGAGRCRFADDAEVFPGVRTMYLGGHAPCSQAILLNSQEGMVIIASDDVYLYSLLENNILPRIRTSETRIRAALDRLVRRAIEEKAIVIAMHDPVVWEMFEEAGDGWLDALRPISDRAVQGYARRRGWPLEKE